MDDGPTGRRGPAPRNPIVVALAILNLVFGALGAVCCGGLAVMQSAFPLLAEAGVEAAQAERDAERARREQAFAERLEAAATDEERAEVEAERDRWRAESPEVDFGRMFAIQSDPRLVRYYATDAVGGILLNTLLMVSGVGLLAAARWGRTLALWVAAGKLVLVVAGAFYTVLVITPLLAEASQEMMAEMEEVLAEEGALPPFLAAFGGDMQETFGTVGAFVRALFASIYPIALLVLLNVPSVVRSFPAPAGSPADA